MAKLDKFLGRYEIEVELGRGAMGIVYRARDPRIDRTVAIKTICLSGPRTEAEQEYSERFILEAKAAGRLSHPGIVTIFDVAEDPNTLTSYIVMEYVAGRSLEQMLRAGNGRLPLDTALQLAQELAEALDYAHDQGIVHRDLKPSNIIVGEDGHPKIADFGIAKLNATDLPQAGYVLGTPAYMSPEQLQGDHAVDGRSDLFSLGVILYQLVTEHRPFQGNSTHTISFKVLHRDPVPATALNATLCPELGRVIARAIAKDPAQRYQTGREMAVDLQKVRSGILSSSSCGTQQPGDVRALLTTWDQTISFTKIFTAAEIDHTHSQKDKPQLEVIPVNQPWQQLSISFLTLGLLALAFAALWQMIPVNAAPTLAAASAFANRPRTIVNSPTMREQPSQTKRRSKTTQRTSYSGRVFGNIRLVPSRLVVAKASQAEQQPLPSTLRISVAHHFGTAHLSVWIDEELRYSYPLNGAVKKRMLLFRGVQGYFCDSVEVPGGEQLIRVHVLSADNSYDETESIRGSFTPGSEKTLVAQFDKNDHGMRLSIE